MLKNIKITNSRGDQFEFNSSNRLTNGIDLSGLQAAVNRSQSNLPGSRYQSTRVEEREFDIEFQIRRHNYSEAMMDDKRGQMYKVFNPNFNPMRIDFMTSNDQPYYLMAELISAPIMPPDKSNNNAVWQKALLQFIATDPFIYEAVSHKVEIAEWVGNLEFPLEIPVGGIEIGYRSQSLFRNVYNGGSETSGMLIRFFAKSEIVNPKLINVNTYEELKLNFTMLPGDVVNVSTYRGKRSITLMRNNVQSNIFNTLAFETSTFLQLYPGDNIFRYDADSGALDFLDVSIEFTPTRIGV
ncbi:phage tail domain-containing protein [Robertmurraya sp. FSL W8-0741]|uniref:phage tail domain-containing protein n=1 Tax=Robertmurraya sp. FSL W8-0741 TaxID=2954629 RepID=UPI0030F98585